MKYQLNTILASIFAMALTSCSSSQIKFDTKKASSEKISTTLNDTKWVLQRIDIQNRDFVPTAEQEELVLSFNDNYYGTSDGCNGQGGEVEVKDNQITLKSGMSTLRYCGEEMAHLIYEVPLHLVKSIEIKKDKMKLFNENDEVIATYIKKK